MNNTNWDEFRCRCSGISKIMANSRSNPQLTELQAKRLSDLEKREVLTDKHKEEMASLLIKKGNGSKIVLSAGCMNYLKEIYSWEKYGMKSINKETMEVSATRKGILAENDSITLLSFIDDVYYSKNEDRINNEYLSGQPDIYLGDEVMKATKIIDIKTCFDHPLFLQKLHEELPGAYIWQVKGYCDITGAAEGEIAHCLSNMPEIMVNDFKKRLFYKMNVVTEESPDFLEEWEMLESSMNFDRIPPQQRVFKQKIEPFTDEERALVYDRVKVCRDWLWEFDEYMASLNLIPTLHLNNVE